MIDRTGLNVAATVYIDRAKVDAHKAEVLKSNAEIAAKKKAVDDELASVRKLLEAKALELSQASGDRQANVRSELARLTTKVVELESKRPPVVVVIGPARFPSKDEAETYIEQVKDAARKAGARTDVKPVEPPK